MNLYLFVPHPEWQGVVGSVAVAARDFQRAEGIAIKEARKRGMPGSSFSILLEEIDGKDAEGNWVEVERYRDVEDVERLIFMQFGYSKSDQTANEPLAVSD